MAARSAERSAGLGRPAGSRMRPPPLPPLPAPRTSAVVYGMAAVDCHGRVADRAVLAALGWAAGCRLDFQQVQRLLVIRAHSCGVFQVNRQGHLRLPAHVRHCCGVRTGDRVLLAADPEHGVLVVHPPAALDELVAGCHGRLSAGERA
jgi:hypothetical protein